MQSKVLKVKKHIILTKFGIKLTSLGSHSMNGLSIYWHKNITSKCTNSGPLQNTNKRGDQIESITTKRVRTQGMKNELQTQNKGEHNSSEHNNDSKVQEFFNSRFGFDWLILSFILSFLQGRMDALRALLDC
jgi:hypothetical protein